MVSGLKREELVQKPPEFVCGSGDVFKASLRRMSEGMGRYITIFRNGLIQTRPCFAECRRASRLCTCILHRLDFHADVIGLCLEDENWFNDRVVQAALDHMSGKFLEGES